MILTRIKKRTRTCHAQQWPTPSKSYLERRHHLKAHKSIIDPIVKNFQPNREQERAFCIVAHHACNPYAEQLKMYLGGMGGTGKTQVLKALIQFFKVTNQSHRFVVVAPTGTTAALLGGSTYHYLFVSMKGQMTISPTRHCYSCVQGLKELITFFSMKSLCCPVMTCAGLVQD
jgi:hypothetical protein